MVVIIFSFRSARDSYSSASGISLFFYTICILTNEISYDQSNPKNVHRRREGDGDGFGILRPLIVEPFQDGFVL